MVTFDEIVEFMKYAEPNELDAIGRLATFEQYMRALMVSLRKRFDE